MQRTALAGLAMAVLIVVIGCGSGAQPDSSSATVTPADLGKATIAKKKKRGEANWPTYAGNNARTGIDATSPPLNSPHRIWAKALDGALYAQPLVVGSRVYAATENNTVYALNARNGHVAWKRHLGTPVDGSTLPCGNIDPTGITGTPAISGGKLFVVTFLSGYRHVLFGLRLKGGKVRLKRNIDAPGSDPRVHQERSAMSIANGRVYVPFGGLAGDCGDYKGRVVSIKTRGKAHKKSFTVPVHGQGAIWAPSGGAVNSAGDLFIATGNGDATSGFDEGNSVIKISPKLKQLDFYRASNAAQLNQTDTDLGSVGPTLIARNRLFVIGKEGLGLILNADHLGGTGGQLFSQQVCPSGAYGGLAFQAPFVFVPCSDGLRAVRINGDSFSSAWKAGSGAGAPILAGGAVWTIDGQTLNAYAPATGGSIASFDLGTQTTHFPSPGAGGGRLFAPAGSQIVAFAGI